MIKTAFRGRLKTVMIAFTLSSQFTECFFRVCRNRCVYQGASTESMTMVSLGRNLWIFYSLSMSIYYSIMTGYKVYKVQKWDENSWKSATGSWIAEVVSCEEKPSSCSLSPLDKVFQDPKVCSWHILISVEFEQDFNDDFLWPSQSEATIFLSAS